MVYSRDKKDYYCESCEKTLKEIEEPEEFEDEKEDGKEDKKAEKPSSEKEGVAQTVPVRPPEVGTVRGLLFLTIGSIVYIIPAVLCQLLPIIGLFLLIFGFFIIYQDRSRHSNEHKYNMRFAAILFICWIVVNIISIVLSYYYVWIFGEELTDYSEKDIIPNSIIIDFIKNLRIVTILTSFGTGFLAIVKYLSIKKLIHQKYKKLLAIILPILIIAGFLAMMINIDNTNLIINDLEPSTKDDVEAGAPNYNMTTINETLPQSYVVFILGFGSEAAMILCIYLAYTNQRNIHRKKEFI
jgi:hypothetical protein